MALTLSKEIKFLMIMPSTKHFWLAVLALLLPLGCTAPAENEGADDATAPAGAQPAAEDVQLSILSFDEIQERIASKRGQVVVMDAWSTSCPPCLAEFHHLVELHKQYGPDDVACISLSFDYEGGVGTSPADVREPVLKFLRSQGATFDNIVSSEESDDLYRKFKLNSVPAVFVYDRGGALRERFENEGAYEDVRALVAELVEQRAPENGGR